MSEQKAHVSQVYQVITDRIIEKMEKGVTPWRKPWNSKGASLGECKNLISGANYKGINAFLTGLQGFEVPYFLTFNQAKDLGLSVMKGEKGTPIVFWKKTERTDRQTGEITDGFILRYSTVFNVDQVSGWNDRLNAKFAPFRADKEQRPEAERIEACEAIVKAQPMSVGIRQTDERRAYYMPQLDVVHVPKLEHFTKREEYYSTLFHELGHATGHASRLDREGITEMDHFGSHKYSKEELVAEMTAAFLCARAGIDNETLDNSAAYLHHWISALKAEPTMLVKAAAQAQKAANLLLNEEAAPKREEEALPETLSA